MVVNEFKINNKDIKTMSKPPENTSILVFSGGIDVVLMPLLLTLNTFRTSI